MKSISIILICLFSNIHLMHAQGGLLDSTFDIDGISTCFPENFGHAVAIQPDGKIVVGGNKVDFLTLTRFNTDGSLDNTFGDGGLAEIETGFGSCSCFGIALQNDGKIVQSGHSLNYSLKADFVLTRFNSNGTIDNTFNNTGVVFTSFNTSGFSDYGYQVAIQPDGKIVQVGMGINNFSIHHFAVARFNPDGSLDNTFGTGGKVLTTVGNELPRATCVALQPDGKILVGGYSDSLSFGPSSFALVRYNAYGSLDNSFGVEGKVTTYFGTGAKYEINEAMDIALQPDGKILMTGGFFTVTNLHTAIALARYNSDGSLDNSFGEGGKVLILDDSVSSEAHSVAIQQDNKILVAARTGTEVDHDFLLARYSTDGILDHNFGNDGIVIVDVGTTDSGLGVEIQSDNKIIMAGTSSNITVMRFLSGLEVGISDPSDIRELLVYPNPVESEINLQYTLLQEEKITIELYNMMGTMTNSFVNNEKRTQGKHEEILKINHRLPRGSYILQLTAGNSNQRIKVIIY